MRQEEFFTSLNVSDYPEPPAEKKGACECDSCGRMIYSGEDAVRTGDGDGFICEVCLADMMPYEIYELVGKDYNAKVLYSLLGGQWEDV